MNRTATKTTTIDWYQLDCLISGDLRKLENHFGRGLDSRFPISPDAQHRIVDGKVQIQKWLAALQHLRNDAARKATPELVQEWMQLRRQMVMRGPFGIRFSLVPHRTRHYELDH
ncbi:hypothetical protein E4P29_22190 [Rhodococcus sp. 1R11]|uniref:hypothetical protein n=1 Tax=Rhodococcus sp. 1R11 TaxID=2559614 RepID=UPI001071A301|nr:hypothetical protein [Rhodococcus sp. 1R11]TFI40904.1 hypothetical protein E4P29_22190 [Rhodococcus sp. 1R11]